MVSDQPDYQAKVESFFDAGGGPIDAVRLLRSKYGLSLIDAQRVVAPAWSAQLRRDRVNRKAAKN